ncbi:MAG: SagB/ThcOx family dehydrogenase [Anaerolineales bacterium]|nr:SagB/ThcOx family dehydrogenase [Anaerolineales bacterium]
MFTRFSRPQAGQEPISSKKITLPKPVYSSETSVEAALLNRQSTRSYRGESLALSEVGQLLWAAQGITRPGGYRTAPSAGALYPLEVYLLAGDVRDLDSGFYKYNPESHELWGVFEGDKRAELGQAALNQEAIRDAPAVIVISGIYERTTGKYGERGHQYVHMEVGNVAQNIYLQAVSLHLGTVFIGAFYDEDVKKVLQLGENEEPFCILPVGRPEVE